MFVSCSRDVRDHEICSCFLLEPVRTQPPQPSAKWPTAPIPSKTMYHVWPAAPGQVQQGTAQVYYRAPFGILADEQQWRNYPGRPQLNPEAYWELRRAKRYRAVEAIRRTPEFTRAFNVTSWIPNSSMPPEPNPDDREVSKRTWESSIMQWRAALRTIAGMKKVDKKKENATS